MKKRALIMGALAIAIAGAGCSPAEICSPTQTGTSDPGMLIGTVTGPSALGFPAAVKDMGSSDGTRVSLFFNADGGGADGGTDPVQVLVQLYGPAPPFGQPLTLPARGYEFYSNLTDLTNGTALGKPTIRDGTLTLNQTISNGPASNETITSQDLTVTLTLIAPDGSLFGVDAELASQFHTYTGPVVCSPDTQN